MSPIQVLTKLIGAYPYIALFYYGAFINLSPSVSELTQVAWVEVRWRPRQIATSPIQMLTIPAVAYHCNELVYNPAVSVVYVADRHCLTIKLIL